MIRVGLLEMSSGDDVALNMRVIAAGVRDASASGAHMVVLPEAATYRGNFQRDQVHQEDGPVLRAVADLARTHAVTVVLGGIWTPSADLDRPFNTSLAFDRTGRVIARYDKVHLFRLDNAAGESFDEAANTTPGDRLVTFSVGAFTVGMSICYDLRFPQMYQTLQAAGANVLLVPSNFSVDTGPSHWAPLLTARAIENLCYVVAPAQSGLDSSGFAAYGHSMAIDPWGRLLAVSAPEKALTTVDLDAAVIRETREIIRSPEHTRPDAYARVIRNEPSHA